MIDSLSSLETYYAESGDRPETHQFLLDHMVALSNADKDAVRHIATVPGYMSPQLSVMWRWIIESLPSGFHALEIGVNVGAVISWWEHLAARLNKQCLIVGVSTFDGRDVMPDTDCYAATLDNFDKLHLSHPELIKGDSTHQRTITNASAHLPYDLIFIDGGHAESICRSDILHYAPMLRVGGLLVIDDASCKLKLPPSTESQHFFHGIDSVSDAVDALLPPLGTGVLPDASTFEHIFAVMHDRAWRRTA